MRCADLAELLSAHADGETTPAQAEFVVAHLSVCPRCRQALLRQRETRALLELAGADDWAPPDLSLRVTLAYQGRRRGRARAGPLAGLGGTVIAAGLLAVLVRGGTLAPVAAPAPHHLPAATAVVGKVRGCGDCRGLPVARIQSPVAPNTGIAAGEQPSGNAPLQLAARQGTEGMDSTKGGNTVRRGNLHSFVLVPN